MYNSCYRNAEELTTVRQESRRAGYTSLNPERPTGIRTRNNGAFCDRTPALLPGKMES